MTESFLQAGWRRAKQFLPSVIAAGLMFGGMHQIISTFKYPLTSVVVSIINALTRKAFRDVMPLNGEYALAPWWFELRQVAIAVIVFVVGSFVGLWINMRAEHASES